MPTLDKDRSLYRTWTDATPAALAEETRLFLTDAWQGTPNLKTLLTAPVTFVDADLAAFYGLPAPAGAGFQRVDLDPGARGRPADAGVVPGRARQGRPDVADAARQVRAREAVLQPAAAAAAGHRRAAADGRPAPVDARSASRSTPPTQRCADCHR